MRSLIRLDMSLYPEMLTAFQRDHFWISCSKIISNYFLQQIKKNNKLLSHETQEDWNAFSVQPIIALLYCKLKCVHKLLINKTSWFSLDFTSWKPVIVTKLTQQALVASDSHASYLNTSDNTTVELFVISIILLIK